MADSLRSPGGFYHLYRACFYRRDRHAAVSRRRWVNETKFSDPAVVVIDERGQHVIEIRFPVGRRGHAFDALPRQEC